MMKVSRIVMGALVFSLAIVVAVTLWMPSIDDLFIENPYWNGLSEMYIECDPIRLNSLVEWESSYVKADNSTLFIIGPSSGFSEVDAFTISIYLEDGGVLVLMDDFGSGNQLLELLGLDTRFSGRLLKDPLFYVDDYAFPVLLDSGFDDVGEVVMNYPTGLIAGSGEALAYSSPFSYYEIDGETPDASELGSIPVIVEQVYGDGRVYIVSDSSLFINSMIDYRSNRDLLHRLARGVVMVDESHLIPTKLTEAKRGINSFYLFFDVVEARYLGLVLVGLIVFKLKLRIAPEIEEDMELQAVINKHPEWNRDLVEHIFDLREKDG